jgi:glutamate/tyrosine decarboxylase-like PLP-dependent enzyme
MEQAGPGDLLLLDAAGRGRLWAATVEVIESYLGQVDSLEVGGAADPDRVQDMLRRFDFDRPMAPEQAVRLAGAAMCALEPHVRHPRHFGMFDPASTAMGIAGEALTATFNSCLATRSGSPFGVAAEQHLVECFADRFGYPAAQADGIVTSGGSEANITAALLALTFRFPEHRRAGVRALPGQPVLYASADAHPSVLKAARVAGLGDAAVRMTATDGRCRMDPRALQAQLALDAAAGHIPFLLVATAGTTGTGAIDPVGPLVECAREHRMWLHVDAAWGGAGVLLPELRPEFAGIGAADSITFDPHKWLSVPMGCGLLLTRHPGIFERAFDVTAPFLPESAPPPGDPYRRSMRWSRSFAGLKLLLSLAVAGWPGYEAALRRQVELGALLRRRLAEESWRLVAPTPLPVVCFTDARDGAGACERIARLVNGTGSARIFVAVVAGSPVLRACVTNYATTAQDIEALVGLLDAAREQARSEAGAPDRALPVSDCHEGSCLPGAVLGHQAPR